MDSTGDDEITEKHELPQQTDKFGLEGQMKDLDESELENVKIHE